MARGVQRGGRATGGTGWLLQASGGQGVASAGGTALLRLSGTQQLVASSSQPVPHQRSPAQPHTSGSLLRSSADGTAGSTIPLSSRSGSAAVPVADLVRTMLQQGGGGSREVVARQGGNGLVGRQRHRRGATAAIAATAGCA